MEHTLKIFAAIFATGIPVLSVNSPVLMAQSVRQLAPNAGEQFPEPFTAISGVVELGDGTLIVTDRTERTISLVDFASGSVNRVGHRGRGPREYEVPGSLWALSGDSALMMDLGNFRLARLDNTGRIVETVPLAGSSGTPIFPRAVDTSGRLYWDTGSSFSLDGAAGPAAAYLLRRDPASGTVDTLTTLTVPDVSRVKPRTITSEGASVTFRGAFGMPFAAKDAWAVGPGGTVAVARVNNYHLDWIAPDGRIRSGPEVPYESVRITKAEKQDWAKARSGNRVMVIGGSASSGGFRLPEPDIDKTRFPDVMPPFSANGVHMAADGHVWVQRNQPSSAGGALYDVFDSAGGIVERIRLPEGRRLQGFGPHSMYLVVKDEDDLEWLERYDLTS